MRNLCYFCHYHRGDVKEKTIKIAGSVLAATALFLLSGSIQLGSAAQQQGAILSELLPEPGYLIAQDQGQTVTPPAPSAELTQPAQPVQPQPPAVEGQPPVPQPGLEVKEPVKETCRVNGVEMPGPCSNYPPQGELKDAGPGESRPEMKDDDHEQREGQDTARWKQDRLREWRDQLRESAKVRKQLVRLKGSQDELVKLDAIKERLTQCQTQLNAATDNDAMKDVLEGEECGDTGEFWEEINRIRQAVELPKELNNVLRDLNRAKNLCKQKWVDKVFSREECNTIMANFAAKYAEAKAAYQAGEYEDARGILQDAFHEPGWPGDVNGALQMMRGFIEPLRRVKDPELKTQLDDLLIPVKEALRDGEYRVARETMEAIQRELGQKMFNLIFDSERKRRAVPGNVLERIERLQQKFEALEKPAQPEGANPFGETAPAPVPAPAQ
ncbi:hypothetical protein HYW17_05820 [Candidatus Uhrbacteria bacterium]|nr:hypothetical protein [Candidatus Uhrbacteria bacterium]